MVTELVGQARRRFLWNEVLAQSAWALSAAMGAVIVLLLLGTQILDWQWLLLLPAGTFAVGTWRVVRRMPSGYRVAQMVDRRAGLADTLSTAYFFERESLGRHGSREVREWQRAHAERLCGRVRVSEAVPFTMPRAVYVLAILGVAASSLFALRYGLDRRLDLRKPLARILQQAFGLDQQQLAALDKKRPPERKRPDWKDMQGVSLDEGRLPNTGELENAANAIDASSPADSEEVRKGVQAGKQLQEGAGEDAGDEGEASDEPAGAANAGNDDGQQGQNQKGQQQAGSKQTPPGAEGNNSSLMAKFREAMQNLLSRMKPQPTGATSSQKQSGNGQNSRQGKQQAGKGQQGGQQSGGQESEGQEGQPGSDAQPSETASGRGSGQTGEENSSKQPGSGIGKQDGNKDVKLAEQLAAMGKISEIIGKRSASVSGEATVEVQNSNQQLATPYSNRNAAHAETAAEISRDEVPVALQGYVQQYFEQVRRQSAGAKAKP